MKAIFLAGLILLTGCGLIPKRVEFFQDKVHRVPEYSPVQLETQKEAAFLAKERAQVAVEAAIAELSSTNVVAPAKDVAVLTDVVSESLGPPRYVPTEAATEVAASLRVAIAKVDQKIEAFKKENNENVGKKIEGTGAVSVPYFAYLGIVGAVVLILFIILRAVLSAAATANPGAAVALGGVNVASHVISKGFAQIVKGGEEFKTWVQTKINDPALKQQIIDAFNNAHNKHQDTDIKDLVNKVQ